MVAGVGGDRQERFVSNLCATLKSDDVYAPLRAVELETLFLKLTPAGRAKPAAGDAPLVDDPSAE